MCASIRPRLAAFVILTALEAGVFPLSAAADGGIPPSALFPDAVFDPAIPTQAEVLGFEHAERPIRHAELMRYLRTLVDASPRAALFPYAESHEGLELVYFAVSDEATMARLDAFRAAHALRLDPRGRAPSADAALLKDAKAVAWIAYGIHGDELSSVDAAAAIAYRLTAGEDALSRRLREGLVILIDPIENPDGRERYLAQITSFAHAARNPDVEDLSHAGAWPWGRGNHYFFDLNRDWFSLVQPESRRSTEIARWNPQLMVDSHEMGAHDTYLLSPPRHPFNPYLPPSQRVWGERFGEEQARALDARGYTYYTREWNEEFFPGYGSSWASYRGAIGILYEMSGTEGTLVRRRDRVVRTFPQAVEHQATSSIANLTTLADNRAAILRAFVADRRAAIERARKGPIGAWVVPEGRYPRRVRRLVWILRSQGIEVLHADAPRISGLRDAWTGGKAAADAISGPAWIVPLDQPAAPLVRAILDPHVPMDVEFLREEREYLERGKGSRLYEMTAWSLLLSYGVEAYWAPPLRRDPAWKETLIPGFEGHFEDPPDAVAWIVDGVPDAATALLADLLQRGVVVKVGDRPFTVGGREWARGALLIPREGNPADLPDVLAEAAARWRTRIHAVSTAKADSGPDLGGRHFHLLIEPRVGVWTGSPVSPSAYGAIWRLLDEDVRLRFSGLNVSRFRQVDLSRYNVLIFPPVFGGTGVYRQILGGEGLEGLKSWIEAGGTAIGIGGGAEFLADEETGITQARLRRQALERYPPVVLGPGPEQALEGGPFRAIGLRAPATVPDDGKGGKRGAKGEGLPEFRGVTPYDVAPILGAGARPFADGYDLGTPVEMRPVDLADWLRPLLPPGKGKPAPEDLDAADERLRRFRPHGAYLRVEIDPDAWLGWGLPAEMPALIRARDALVAGPPVQVAARFAEIERLHLGGLLWPEAAGRLAHTAYVTREQKGRGQVILFLDPPEIRGWTLATRRLLLNAILFGPGAGTRWSTPW